MQKFGNIQSCTVLRDHAGKSKQVGFVQFSSEEEATSCVSEMHGKVSPLPRFPLAATCMPARQEADHGPNECALASSVFAMASCMVLDIQKVVHGPDELCMSVHKQQFCIHHLRMDANSCLHLHLWQEGFGGKPLHVALTSPKPPRTAKKVFGMMVPYGGAMGQPVFAALPVANGQPGMMQGMGQWPNGAGQPSLLRSFVIL